MAVALSVACEASAPADAGRLFVPASLILHSHYYLDPSLSLWTALAKVLLRSCEADALAGSRNPLSVTDPATMCSSEPNRFSLLSLRHDQGVVRPMDCQVQEHGASWCHSSYTSDSPQMQYCIELHTCPSSAQGDAAARIRSVQLLAP